MEQKKNNYITPKGYQNLETELNELLHRERPEVLKLIQWAASNGDRSENADYLYGKKRLREIDRRIRFLNTRINLAVIIDPCKINSQKIQFGAKVKVLDDQGNKKVFTIVGVDEVNTSQGYISWQSPIGASLIGKTQGDEVVIKVPSGEIFFEILDIIYEKVVI